MDECSTSMPLRIHVQTMEGQDSPPNRRRDDRQRVIQANAFSRSAERIDHLGNPSKPKSAPQLACAGEKPIFEVPPVRLERTLDGF